MRKSKYITKNFLRAEFDCKCGCGKNNISTRLVNQLQRSRDILGESIIITSGCRCEKWNVKAGGSPTSAHLSGLASDVNVVNSQGRYLLVCSLLNAGFQRIGAGESFLHVDIDYSRPTPSLFLYPKD